MTEDQADNLINELCKEVYNSANGVCLVLVGASKNGELSCSVRGVAKDVYDLDNMIEAIKRYQDEQHAAIDENGIPRLTGIKVDKEMEKECD